MESTPRAVRTLSQLYCSPAARAASGVCWRFSPRYQGSYVAQHWRLSGERMDNVTLIRVVAGILAGVVVLILLFRMKKKAPR